MYVKKWSKSLQAMTLAQLSKAGDKCEIELGFKNMEVKPSKTLTRISLGSRCRIQNPKRSYRRRIFLGRRFCLPGFSIC